MMEQPESEYLDKVDLKRLTAEARIPKQSAWLKQRGIPHQTDGQRVIVSRLHVRRWLEGKPTTASNGPAWSKIA